ncbi:UPF0149 family protein [Motiliproteus sp. SC1-56]|uniref:UPF0149 family protein n=1 Tax=Motiliproteus sp. SC1-56 TaxID=2799565 RepID=UPI001A8EE839
MSKELSDLELPGFDDLADDFVRHGALGSPAELHGYLCGQLSAGQRLSAEGWLGHALELIGVEEAPSEEMSEDLRQLYALSLSQFEGDSFDFALLLPEENCSLAQRAQSLGHWCHGFLSGFSLAGGKLDKDLSAEAQDAMQDFAQIAQISADEEGGEENEADFMEVHEYVRMAALLVFSECNRVPGGDQALPPGTPLH